MGIKGWSLRDGILEGEGWRCWVEKLEAVGKSLSMALSEDTEWGEQGR